MTSRARGVILISAFLACLVGGVVGAQGEPADPMETRREKARALMLGAALNLTEGEAKTFWPVYNSYQSDMITYYSRVAKFFIDTCVQAYGSGSMTDETATQLLGEFLALETDHVAILKSYAQRFRRVLPPVKVVRLYQIESELHALMNYEIARETPLIK
jgi:hypothetical protein